MPPFAPRDVQATGSRSAAAREPRQAAGHPLARHLQQPLPPGDGDGRGRGARGRRLPRRRAARARSAAAGRSTTTACSTSAKRYLERDPRRAARRDPRPACRSSGSSRAASRSSATSCRTCFPNDEDAKRLCAADVHAQRVPRRSEPATSRRSCERKALVHGHCHHKARAGLRRRAASCSRRWASTSRCSTPAAAAWPARSASRRATTTSRSRAASACSSRRCARRRRRARGRRRLLLHEQIEQGTGRRALHLAEVLQLAHGHHGRAAAADGGDARCPRRRPRRGSGAVVGGVLALRER